MNLLDRLKIKAKLMVVLGLTAMSLIVAVLLAASVLHQKMMDERIGKLRGIVETAMGLAQALDDEVVAGHMSRDDAIVRLRNQMHAMWYDGHKDYIFVLDMDGISIANAADPKQVGTSRAGLKDVNGKPITGSFIKALTTADEGVVDYYYPKPGQTDPMAKVSVVRRFKPWNMIFGTGVYIDDLEAEYHSALLHLGLAALALLAIVMTVVFFINRNISGSLATLKGRMAKLAEGDVTVAIDEATRGDEIGDMARAVQVFKENAQQMQRLRDEQEEMKQKAEFEKRQAMADLANAFQTKIRGIVDALAHSASAMQTTARSMAETADSARQQSGGGGSLRAALRIDRRDRPACRAGLDGLQEGGGRGRAHQRHCRGARRVRSEDRRSGGAHQRHRLSDQSARAQRDHRGGTRGRGRKRLCRGSKRGQIAGQPDRQGDR